jgi:hypothetical protein
VQVEGRPHRLERERLHGRTRHLAPHQVGQQRGDQRAVHDQARVALHLGHVLAVVVDAVAVEGEGRVAEQQHVVRHDLARPHGAGGRGLRGRRRVARLRRAAVDDVVLLGERQAGGVVHLVANQHEHQLAAAPALAGDRLDARDAPHRLAHPQRREELQPAARPHAPRQRHRRQEAAALRVAVGADLALARLRQEVQPVRQRRDGVAARGRRVVAVQRGRPAAQRRGGDLVVQRLGAALPGGQVGGVAHACGAPWPESVGPVRATPPAVRNGRAGVN